MLVSTLLTLACAVTAGGGGAGCAATTHGSAGGASPAEPDPRGENAAAEQVRARITALRAGRGLGPAAPFNVAQNHLTFAKRSIVEDGLEPEVAFEHGLQAGADEGERDILYWCLRTERLEDLRLPPELVRPAPLNLAVAVVRQPEGKRPRYLVLLATPSPSRDQVNWQ